MDGPAPGMEGSPARGIVQRRRVVAAIVLLIVVIGVLVWRLTDEGGGGPPKVVGTPAEVVSLVNGRQRALESVRARPRRPASGRRRSASPPARGCHDKRPWWA